MGMHNPPHPGGIVKRQCLEPLGLTVTRAAEGMGVTRQALSELVNERTGVSVEMAIRLSRRRPATARYTGEIAVRLDPGRRGSRCRQALTPHESVEDRGPSEEESSGLEPPSPRSAPASGSMTSRWESDLRTPAAVPNRPGRRPT